MKKLISLLVVVLVLSLSGCDGGISNENNNIDYYIMDSESLQFCETFVGVKHEDNTSEVITVIFAVDSEYTLEEAKLIAYGMLINEYEVITNTVSIRCGDLLIEKD